MTVTAPVLALVVGVTAALISATAAIAAVFMTAYLARQSEREADWRKLKLVHYQQFVLALSGIVGGRSDADAQAKFADAVNSMALIAPLEVLKALAAFQNEISQKNLNRTAEAHDRLLDGLYKAMRSDIHPQARLGGEMRFHIIGLPDIV